MSKLQTVFTAFLLAGCATGLPMSEREATLVLVNADDGLSLRLADAIRNEVAKSTRLLTTPSDGRATLTIRIPTNVEWKQVEGRTLVKYRVEYERAGNSRASSGTCWESELSRCGEQIVAAAITSAGAS
jgi:hypothetical protein